MDVVNLMIFEPVSSVVNELLLIIERLWHLTNNHSIRGLLSEFDAHTQLHVFGKFKSLGVYRGMYNQLVRCCVYKG